MPYPLSPTGDSFPETFCYDPTSNSWSDGPDMTTPRVEIASATVDGEVYAFGGRTPAAFATARNEVLLDGTISVQIDVKPGSEENPVNLKSKGVSHHYSTVP